MRHPIHPPGWAAPKGYAHGIVANGPLLFIAGQVGCDPTERTPSFPPTFGAQFELALANLLEVLREAGGAPDHLCRLTMYVTDKREYLAALRECGEVWRRRVGRAYPAMTVAQVVALVPDDAKLELEGTAVLPSEG